MHSVSERRCGLPPLLLVNIPCLSLLSLSLFALTIALCSIQPPVSLLTRSFVLPDTHHNYVLSLEDNEACFGFDSPAQPVDAARSPYAIDVLNTTAPQGCAQAGESETPQALTGGLGNWCALIDPARLAALDTSIATLQEERLTVLAKLRALSAEPESAAGGTSPRAAASPFANGSGTSPRAAASPVANGSGSPRALSSPLLNFERRGSSEQMTSSPAARASPRLSTLAPTDSSPLSRASHCNVLEPDHTVSHAPTVTSPAPSPSHPFERKASFAVPSAANLAVEEEICQWPPSRVCAWLALVDLGHLATLFQRNGISGMYAYNGLGQG